MSDATRYQIPAGRARAEHVVDRSRFVCTLDRAATPDDAQTFIREMTGEFADATHNCWAFVVGAPGTTGRVGMSDDGEPHGTAGRPMLTVLLHCHVGEIVAVVTRYYGGVKLGTGGLARAYSAAVLGALAELPREERVEYHEVTVIVAYSQISAVQHLLPLYEADVLEACYAAEVRYRLRAPVEQLALLRGAVGNATSGTAVFLDDAAAGQ